MSGAAAMRLFFALWPDDALRERFATLARAANAAGAAREVSAQNFHLTLAFIGATPIDRLGAVRAVAAGVRGYAGALRFDALDYWPKPEVLVAAARNPEPLFEALWRDLHRALGDAGFVLQPKSWRPHVTLLRKMSAPPPPIEFAPIDWTASNFVLAESHTDAAGARYTVVGEWPLLYDGVP